MRPKCRSGPRSRGQALVEFALAIPMFLFIVFGFIDLGRLAYINNALAQGAREGSRWGSVLGRTSSLASIETRAVDSLTGVPNPDPDAQCVDGNKNLSDTCGVGDVLVVQIDSDVTLITPVLSQIVGPQSYSAISKTTIN
jgi:hypothetical protein